MFVLLPIGTACPTPTRSVSEGDLPQNPSLALWVSMQSGVPMESIQDFAAFVLRTGENLRFLIFRV